MYKRQQPSAAHPLGTTVSLPIASSTTGGDAFDADNKIPELQRDKSDLEPEREQGDKTDPREPKYRIGMFIKKEVDNIECTGFIHGYVLDKESFVYHVHLIERDTEESITKEDILIFFFI